MNLRNLILSLALALPALAEPPKIPTEGRSSEILIFYHKKVKDHQEPSFALEYAKASEICFSSPNDCLLKAKENPHLASFYAQISPQDKQTIEASLESPEAQSEPRANLLNLLFVELAKGVQEYDGPNDDSQTGTNQIRDYFRASGVMNPYREIASKRVDWAWCAAFVAAITNKAGLPMNFTFINEYLEACRGLGAKDHCHPIQVDFIGQWGKQKGLFRLLESAKPGDILVQHDPVSGRGAHAGFFLAQGLDCLNGAACVYSIEGNAGPSINDELEDEWDQVQSYRQKGELSEEAYQRLLDRVSIVKRPATSWDYIIEVSP